MASRRTVCEPTTPLAPVTQIPAAPFCLARSVGLREDGAVHGVLAGYWLARPVAASGDWGLPVAQVFPDGKPQLWGNDRGGYEAPFDAVAAIKDRLAFYPDRVEIEVT